MEIINFADHNSLVGQFLKEMRDVNTQGNRLLFRNNIHRIGQIMAYEISKRLTYEPVKTTTCLGVADEFALADGVVIATILRAGLPLHEGFLSYFDKAENAFVSAYRKYRDGSDEFDINIEYIASPSIEGKVLLLVDPMLATGASMELAYKALLTKGTPKHVHIASVIASKPAVEYVKAHFAAESTTVWVGAIDPTLNAHSYIVPGLGDAGDLAYGEKE
ncbi:MAG: uracil phosphoribosyltransferase [Muribaculaceae bacterium]